MTKARQTEAGTGSSDAEEVVDELLSIPPGQFTEARNAAVKRLRAHGQSETADAIKGLPRPPVSLWALNQLARRQPALIETFLRAADQLRAAHRSGGDIRAATTPERDAEAHVVGAAAELARAEGMSVTETAMGRLRQTMHAAAADADVAAALRDGRLLREPAEPSLDELLGSMSQAPAAAKAETAPRRDRTAERDALRAEIAAAKSDASEARSDARAAADSAREAQREWERAQKLAERTQRSSDEAAERLRDLQARLEEL